MVNITIESDQLLPSSELQQPNQNSDNPTKDIPNFIMSR
jgi:hypothetical protein